MRKVKNLQIYIIILSLAGILSSVVFHPEIFPIQYTTDMKKSDYIV